MPNCSNPDCGKRLYPFEEAYGDGEHCSHCRLEMIAKRKRLEEKLQDEGYGLSRNSN